MPLYAAESLKQDQDQNCTQPPTNQEEDAVSILLCFGKVLAKARNFNLCLASLIELTFLLGFDIITPSDDGGAVMLSKSNFSP
jgi:hypothetical protein